MATMKKLIEQENIMDKTIDDLCVKIEQRKKDKQAILDKQKAIADTKLANAELDKELKELERLMDAELDKVLPPRSKRAVASGALLK